MSKLIVSFLVFRIERERDRIIDRRGHPELIYMEKQRKQMLKYGSLQPIDWLVCQVVLGT
jgi:hypothetical protein